MSAGHSRQVDLDLLADYVGGALDGTDQEAAVTRLIAEDPAWAQAHTWLGRAMGDVREVLAEWGAVAEPMPPDVVGRLTAALMAPGASADAQAPPDAQTAADTDAPADTAATPDATPKSDVPAQAGRPGPGIAPRSPLQPDRGARPLNRRDGRARRRAAGSTRPAGRRMPRWVTPVAVVAAVVAFGGLGVAYLAGHDPAVVNGTAGLPGGSAERGDAASTTASSQPFAASPPARLLATGTDYTRTSLADQVNRGRRAHADTTTTKSGPSIPERAGAAPASASGAPGDQESISACLAAIATEHGRGALRVEWVDSASFEGVPALVVVFADAGGERWAWAVSPDCGQPQVGAATRYRTRVG